MKLALTVWVGFVLFSCVYYAVQGFPHQSTEESDDSTEREVEVVIVAQVAGTESDVTSGETSRESHEFKSREEADRGSVSDSDEPNAPEDDPIVAEDVAKFADDDSKMADEEARSPVYHPKMAEEQPIVAEEKSKGADDESKGALAKVAQRRVTGFPKLSEVDRMFGGQPAKKMTSVPKKSAGDTKLTDEESKGSGDVDSVSEEEAVRVEDTVRKIEQELKLIDDASKGMVEPMVDPRRVPGFPKIAEVDTKSPEEGARSPVYHPKMTEAEPKPTEDEPKGAEDDTKGTEEEESDEDDAAVKFPKAGSCPICPKGAATNDKTESLCPARPEEMTKIEAECAEEFKQWKEMRAKKFAQQTAAEKMTTTSSPSTEPSTSTSTTGSTMQPSTVQTTRAQTVTDMVDITRAMEAVEQTEMEATTNDITDHLVVETTIDTSPDSTDSNDDLQATTTEEYIPMEMEEEDLELPETDVPLMEPTTTPIPSTTTTPLTTSPRMTTTTWMTTTRPIRRSGKQKRSSRKIVKKRSCYPATCILRKLNLLDSMGQPSIERIQSFAINMTVDESTNLEQKAVGCVKEINEAMIDASGDIGKKVGCVAQKVITCLNKGLSCPIMKVPQ